MRFLLLFRAVGLLAAFLAPAPASAAGDSPTIPPPAPNAAWPLFRGDPEMRGISPEALAPPLEPAWTFETGQSVVATAVIADGRAYIGSHSGVFHAIDLATGKEAWQFETKDRIEASGCIAGEAVVFGSGDGFLYALRRTDGSLLWKYETEGQIMGAANVFANPDDGESYIVVGSYDFFLHCVNLKSGAAKWKFETDNNVNGAPSLAGNQILFGGCDGFLHALDARTGEKIGSFESGAYIANTVAARDGKAYIATYGNEAAAFDVAAGKKLWLFRERDFEYFASPAVTDASVLTASRDKRLYRLDRATGDVVWEFKARKPIDSSPVVSGGQVFFGSDDGFLYAIDYKSGEESWSYEIGDEIKSSPAIGEGLLVIGCGDGNVYAFKPAPTPRP